MIALGPKYKTINYLAKNPTMNTDSIGSCEVITQTVFCFPICRLSLLGMIISASMLKLYVQYYLGFGHLFLMWRHSSEIRCFCLMKWPSETLQNLPYFIYMKTQSCFFHFSFHVTLFFSPYECPGPWSMSTFAR